MATTTLAFNSTAIAHAGWPTDANHDLARRRWRDRRCCRFEGWIGPRPRDPWPRLRLRCAPLDAPQQGTTLLTAAFDPDHPVRAANPVPVIEKVLSAPQATRDGTLIYIPSRGESSELLVWVDRDGRPTPVGGERLDYTTWISRRTAVTAC